LNVGLSKQERGPQLRLISDWASFGGGHGPSLAGGGFGGAHEDANAAGIFETNGTEDLFRDGGAGRGEAVELDLEGENGRARAFLKSRRRRAASADGDDDKEGAFTRLPGASVSRPSPAAAATSPRVFCGAMRAAW
jgi:hypothetical protein